MRNRILFAIWTTILALVSAGAQQKESLLIGPGDLVQINVFDTPELDQTARVTDAGTIPLVMGGDVAIASKTPEQAARAIEKTLLDGLYLLHPRVTVAVVEFATEKVTVIGEVKLPGAYPISTPRSVLDVLSLAGGLNDAADRHVLIERRGTGEKIPYFVSNQANVAVDSAVTVNPGDSIYVPRAALVYVLGDVAHPGGYTMTNNEGQISVLELIARAGGTNHSAVPSHARIMRKAGGSYTETPLNLSAMQKGKLPDQPLEANDIIYVPFSYMRNFSMQATGIVASVGSAAVYQF